MMKRICLTGASVILSSGLLLAQEIPFAPTTEAKPATEEKDKNASYVIFSNLGSPGDLFVSDTFYAQPLAGKDAGVQEQWDAVLFVPQYDVQASVLEAAIGYSSGTRLITLGIYNEDPNLPIPGTPLAGGVVSTTQIPDLGDCCQLTNVILPNGGVTLSAGTRYWLVAEPDDSKGADFSGGGRRRLLVSPLVLGRGIHGLRGQVNGWPRKYEVSA